MRIKSILGTTILASSVLLTQVVLPAHAGPGDPSVQQILDGLQAQGEFGRIQNGIGNGGFQEVRIFNIGDDPNLVTPKRIDQSSSLNSGGGSSGSGNSSSTPEERYGDAASNLSSAFGGNDGLRGVTDVVAFIRGTTTESLQLGLQRAESLADAISEAAAINAEAARQAREDAGTAEDQEARDRDLAKFLEDLKRREPSETEIFKDDEGIDFTPEIEFGEPKGPKGFKEEIIESYHVKKGQGYVKGGTVTPSGDKVTGKFYLAKPKARMPWAVTLSTSYSGLDDDRDNADRDANIWSITGSAAVKINPKTVLGGAVTLKEGEVNSTAQKSVLDGRYLGFTLYGSHQVNKVVNVSVFGGYTHGENDIDLDGATGSFDSDRFNIGAQVQGRYFFGDGMRFNPDLTLGLANTKNDTFLSSNGVQSDATDITSFTASLGGTLSKTMRLDQGVFTASLGLHALYEESSNGDLQLLNGNGVENRLGYGVSIAPAFQLTMANGNTVGLTTNYSQYEDVSSWTVGAQLRIPLN